MPANDESSANPACWIESDPRNAPSAISCPATRPPSCRVSDAAFAQLWSEGAGLSWNELVALSDRLAAADTRPERKKSLRKETLRRVPAS